MLSQTEELSGSLARPYVLLVDDDEDQLCLFKAFLETLSHCPVITASSAAEAIQIVNEIHVDLLVTDINMPEISGKELISRLREASDQKMLPIIAVSADTSLSADDILNLGADDFFYKTQTKALIEKVGRMLSGQNGNGSSSLLGAVQSRFSH